MQFTHSPIRPDSLPDKSGKDRNWRRRSRRGFSLVELLVVMGIIVIMGAVSLPALMSIMASNAANQASTNVAGLMEYSRQYAMTQQTYVRVGIATVQENGVTKETILLPIYSSDGTTGTSMSDADAWPLVRKPVVLPQTEIDNSLNISINGISTSSDSLPSSSDMGTFTRDYSGLPTGLSFSSIIQFNPHGEAQIEDGTTARHIKIAMSRVGQSDDPFIVRIAGAGGYIRVLRKEDGS